MMQRGQGRAVDANMPPEVQEWMIAKRNFREAATRILCISGGIEVRVRSTHTIVKVIDFGPARTWD